MSTIATDINQSIFETDVLVVVNPYTKFSESILGQIERYVREGGSILIVDSQKNESSTAYQILCKVGMKIDRAPLRISGGTSVILSKDSPIKAMTKKVGKGVVTAAIDAMYFSDKGLGPVMQTPNEQQKGLYSDIYTIFETCLSHRVSEQH